MMKMAIEGFRCHTEAGEVGAYKPYVIVTAIYLRGGISR
jgi:hypothetical protein